MFRPDATPPMSAIARAQPLPRLSAATQGWLLGVLGVLIFALTIPMTRLASGSLTAPQLPAEFVAIGRAALAGLLAVLWLGATRAPWPRPTQWRQLVLTALGVVFGFPLFLGWAVQRVDAAHAAMVSGLLPIATALTAALLMRQRPSRGFWACALLGTVLVLGFAFWKGGARLQAADALLVAAVLWGGVGYVLGARLSAPQGDGLPTMAPQQVISWALVASLPVTLPLTWASWPAAPVHLAAWGGFLYVSVFSMWLGFFAWYRGLQLGGMLRVSQVQLLQPFLSMWLAVPVLGEPLDAATVGFSLAVMATVFLSRRMAVVAAPSDRVLKETP
jgi:drug/metabolite transporter (DMT)-like permease